MKEYNIPMEPKCMKETLHSVHTKYNRKSDISKQKVSKNDINNITILHSPCKKIIKEHSTELVMG